MKYLEYMGLRIYYIYDYVPKNKPRLLIDETDVEIQGKILDYKDSGNSANSVVMEMTDVIHQSLKELSWEIAGFSKYDKYLIAVPTSSRDRVSTVANSIDIICHIDESFEDKCSLLYRSKDLEPQHLRKREKNILEILEDSLDCLYDNMDKVKNSVYFLIDDIVTLGNSMLSCVKTLEKHGINRNKIICLALAKTRSECEEF